MKQATVTLVAVIKTQGNVERAAEALAKRGGAFALSDEDGNPVEVVSVDVQGTQEKCHVEPCPNPAATSYRYCASHQQQRFRAEDHGERFVVDGQCHSASCRGECGTHEDPYQP